MSRPRPPLRLLAPTLLWAVWTAVELTLRQKEPAYWTADFTRSYGASLALSFGLFHLAAGGFGYLLGRFPRAALAPVFLYGLALATTLAYQDGLRIADVPLPTPVKFAAALLARQLPRAFVVPGVTPIFWGLVVGAGVFGAFVYLRVIALIAPQTRAQRPWTGLLATVGLLPCLLAAPFFLEGSKTDFLPMIGEVHAARVARAAYRYAYPPKDDR